MKKRETTETGQQYITALKSVMFVVLFFISFCTIMWGLMILIRLAMGEPAL